MQRNKSSINTTIQESDTIITILSLDLIPLLHYVVIYQYCCIVEKHRPEMHECISFIYLFIFFKNTTMSCPELFVHSNSVPPA